MTPRILGVDPSLTRTGVAHGDGTGALEPGGLKGLERLLWHRDTVIHYFGSPEPVDLAVIELKPPSKGAYAGEFAALGWFIRAACRDHGIPYVDVHPSWVKIYALGKGGGKGTEKRDLAVAAFEHAGEKFDTDDECDAWWMRAMALHHYDFGPVCSVPSSHWRALDKIDWPVLPAHEPNGVGRAR